MSQTLWNGKIIGHAWFSGKDTVGVVAIQRVDGWRAFIGVAKTNDPEHDKKYIVSWGAVLPKDIAIAMFPGLPAENYV